MGVEHPLAITAAESPAPSQRGSALIWALVFVVVTSGMVVTHAMFLAASRQRDETRIGQDAILASVSNAGVQEGLEWFRRQLSQPVLEFEPWLDPHATPPAFDTIDPAVGLVREYQIDRALWARYEIRRDEVVDISTEFDASRGVAWEFLVRGMVFRRQDPSRRFDQFPNRVLFSRTESSIARRVEFRLPALSALTISKSADVSVGNQTRILGGSQPGVVSGRNNTLLGIIDPIIGAVLGTPGELTIDGLDPTPQAVFGMSLSSLNKVSDLVFSETRKGAALDIGNRVTSLNGAFLEESGLYGRDAVVAASGPTLTFAPGSVTKIQGILYVDGDLIVQGELSVEGSVVVTGQLVTNDGVPVTLQYDEATVQRVTERLGRYRPPRMRTAR